jgi:uncharacterized protein (DUF2062 family)
VTTIQPRRAKGGLQRLLRYRLLVPVLRAKHPPEYTARGVMIGLLVAMTPTVGVQMPIVLAVWFAIRIFWSAWDFNVVIACAWTWVTNIFTLGPVYYLFLVSGRLMMGQPGDPSGYSEFVDMLAKTLSTDAGFFESLWIYTVDLFEIWGIPMFLGSVPWAIVSAFVGYRWSLKLLHRVRARRQRNRLLRKGHTVA